MFTCCQNILDEKVARLHLAKIGVELDELNQRTSSLYRCKSGGALQAGILQILKNNIF